MGSAVGRCTAHTPPWLQIKQARQWQPTKHVRLLCAGRELFPDDPVTKATAKTLHCMATDAMPKAPTAARKVSSAPAPPPEQPPVDWVRMSHLHQASCAPLTLICSASMPPAGRGGPRGHPDVDLWLHPGLAVAALHLLRYAAPAQHLRPLVSASCMCAAPSLTPAPCCSAHV
jgi:hypothetical protein